MCTSISIRHVSEDAMKQWMVDHMPAISSGRLQDVLIALNDDVNAFCSLTRNSFKNEYARIKGAEPGPTTVKHFLSALDWAREEEARLRAEARKKEEDEAEAARREAEAARAASDADELSRLRLTVAELESEVASLKIAAEENVRLRMQVAELEEHLTDPCPKMHLEDAVAALRAAGIVSLSLGQEVEHV